MHHLKRRQQGVIFLALALVLLVTGTGLVINALNNRQTSTLAQQEEVRRQLELAKQALLTYAAEADVLFSVGPGHLPCPDLDNDGEPNVAGETGAQCDPASVSPLEYIGRLPEYVELSTLDASGNPERFYLNDAYADIDQQFWYAVSPDYINGNSTTLYANSTVAGTLTVDGTGGIVAVIIAPGESLGQNRPSATDHGQYLEGGNGANKEFVTSYAANPEAFNDTVVTITHAELMTVTTVAVARRIKLRMHQYRTSCTYFPQAWKSFLCNSNFSSALTNFRSVINGGVSPTVPNWVKSTAGTALRQYWATAVNTYTQVSADEATLTFTNCANMIFTYRYDTVALTTSFSHTGTSC